MVDCAIFLIIFCKTFVVKGPHLQHVDHVGNAPGHVWHYNQCSAVAEMRSS